MTDVTPLVNRICRTSGLSSTTGSDDRINALDALNRAYKRIAMETNCIRAYAQITPVSTSSLLSGFAIVPLVIRSVHTPDGTSNTRELKRLTFERLHELKRGTGSPAYYAYEGGTLWLDAIDGSTVTVRYVGRAPALTEGQLEANIVGIDPMFHDDLLGEMGLAYALEGDEGQEERAAYYRNRASLTMQLFKEHLQREGGTRYASYARDRWDTASPVEAR